MKIYYIDMPNKKISKWHESYWISQGHEVKHDMYFKEDLLKWADVCINLWCEGSAGELATYPKEGTHAKRYIQIVDIDAWYGHYRGIDWTNIDGVIFMSKHIQEMCAPFFQDKFPNLPQYHFPLGIDLTQWTFSERDGNRHTVGFVADEWWSAKNPAMVVQFMAKLIKESGHRNWKFDWRGAWGPEQWLRAYIDHMIKETNLTDLVNMDLTRVPDLNAWWDQQDYFVTFSQKDSYSLIVGEAMAKGIKTLTHNWFRAKDIWDEKYVWTTIDEAVEKILKQDYNSQEYREYIAKNHDIMNVMKKWDTIL